MRRAIFPGSFDPPTNGHLDIIKRSQPLFDEIIISVLNNPEKNPLFSVDERCDMIRDILPSVENGNCKITVESFSGLTADFAKKRGATAIVRGIRAVSDYEYELRMALMNRRLEPEIETVFVMASPAVSFVSSSGVKEIAAFGGNVEELVPEPVARRLKEMFPDGREGPPLSPQE